MSKLRSKLAVRTYLNYSPQRHMYGFLSVSLYCSSLCFFSQDYCKRENDKIIISGETWTRVVMERLKGVQEKERMHSSRTWIWKRRYFALFACSVVSLTCKFCYVPSADVVHSAARGGCIVMSICFPFDLPKLSPILVFFSFVYLNFQSLT